jgi:iron complex outermembrane receptor protein
MSSNTVQGEAYIRGIGTDIASIGADPSVAFLLDGVYLPRLSTAMQDLYDVDRVEILEGPQGTLYGRNATGGVVNIISQLPTSDFTYKADAIYGNYNEQVYRASVSGPLDGSDDLTGRFTFARQSHDGYVENLTTGGSIDSVNDWASRGILRYQPSSKLDIVLSADLSWDGGSPATAVQVLSNDSPAVLFFGGIVPNNPYKTTENSPSEVDNTQGGVSAKVSWDLGGMKLTSLSAVRFSHVDVAFDSDGTNANFLNTEAVQDSKTASEDLQLTSGPGLPLDWIIGLSYFNESASSDYNVNAPLLGLNINPLATNVTNAYAAYAQGTYNLLDNLQVTAGLRYSYEIKHSTLDELASGVSAGAFVGSKGWNALTPKFGVQYFPTEQTMLYASATRGFKSGGFNSTALQTPQGFSPEYVWSYEAGIKNTFFDQHLRLNADAFYYDYSDLQVNVFNAASITTIENAAKATVEGLELEADAIPIDGWTLGANMSFLDPKYDNYVSVNPDDPGAGPINLQGNTMVRAPKFTTDLSSEYTTPLSDMGSLTGRIEYFYRSRVYFTPYDEIGVSQPGYGLWNARLTYDFSSHPWSLSLFVNNLANQIYYQEKARTPGLVGTLGWVGDPRTFGVELTIHN